MRSLQFTAKHFLATQLARPSGFFGRYVMGRFLNRITSSHNALVLDDLALAATDRVLEVGFGGGALLESILKQEAGGFVAGVEISGEMVAMAMSRFRDVIATGRLDLRSGSVASLPYPDAHFDKACSVNTVYFWPGLAPGLAELARVIRPGGRLVLGFTSDEEMRRVGLDRHGFTPYSAGELKRALTEQGFRPSEVRSGSDARGTFFVLAAYRT
jgi:SAM-dependent methyltransferase